MELNSCLDLIRRLPLQNIENNILCLIDLLPEKSEDLLSVVDQPLRSSVCDKTGKEFLICDYNRDGDSYRSPWSNQYYPPLENGLVPSENLRKLEVSANSAFNTYRELYYESGLSSVYLWEIENGFAAAVLFKKTGDQIKKMKGTWDSIHVIEVFQNGHVVDYKLTSTIMLSLLTCHPDLDDSMLLSGAITRQMALKVEQKKEPNHVANMGRMIEEFETKLRSVLQEIYFGKTKDIVNELRSLGNLTQLKEQHSNQMGLADQMNQRKSPSPFERKE